MNEFDTGFPTGAFSELIKFSFIKTDLGEKYSIHQLMRKSLQEHQNPVDRVNIHKFLLNYYKYKLKDMDIRAITQEHENALTEAFYHAKKSLGAEELLNWFINVSNPFYAAAYWQLITPIYTEMLQILEVKLWPEYRSVGMTLNYLADLYRRIGNYEKALPLYQRALDIRENVLGPEHPDVATSLNNLAVLYVYMGDYEKALLLWQRDLEISEKVLGPNHPDVATTLNNLAELYCLIGDYKKALSLHQRTLDIREKILGSQHPDVETSLYNLAELYNSMGDYENARLLYQRIEKNAN